MYCARSIVAVVLSVQLPVLQSMQCAAADRSTPEVTFRVYNYSLATQEDVREMESIARQILSQSGVRLRWIQCSPVLTETGGYSQCGLPLRGASFQVLVMNGTNGFRNTALAGTMEGTAILTVFYTNSSRLASIRDLPVGRVLAHAAMHELGHSLLGAPHHAVSGIMKRQFGPDDLDDMQRGWLVFTPEQSRLLRTQIVIRMARPY